MSLEADYKLPVQALRPPSPTSDTTEPDSCGFWHLKNVPIPTHSMVERWTYVELKTEIIARTKTNSHSFVACNLLPDVDGANFLKYCGDKAYWCFIRRLIGALPNELACVARLMSIPMGFFYEEGKLMIPYTIGFPTSCINTNQQRSFTIVYTCE